MTIRDSLLLEETYLEGLRKDEITALYSATKSINSLLIGIAIDEGLLAGTEEDIYTFFPEYPTPENTDIDENPNIRSILTMTCGFDWNERQYSYADPRNIYNRWKGAEDRVGFVLGLDRISRPGMNFNYNTGASHLVPAILGRVSGESALEFAYSRLFKPLGIDMDKIYWPTDSMGIQRAGGLHLTPPDLARIGYLVLRKGQWKGKQLVPEEWINASLTEQITVGYAVDFGYHWWIHHYKDTMVYAAEGYAGQPLYIVPSVDAVVVMTGELTETEDIPF